MPKIYTKNGDNGITSSFDGTKISKTNKICCFIGEIDELSSRIGIVYSLIPEKLKHSHGIKELNIKTDVKNYPKFGCRSGKEPTSPEKISITYLNILNTITNIQRTLQQINSIISKNSKIEEDITKQYVTDIENNIDFMSVQLPPLTKFILPGVSHCDAHVHICRTQTRKVERLLIEIKPDIYIGENIFKYMNRLSDFFFILARWICYKENLSDRF